MGSQVFNGTTPEPRIGARVAPSYNYCTGKDDGQCESIVGRALESLSVARNDTEIGQLRGTAHGGIEHTRNTQKNEQWSVEEMEGNNQARKEEWCTVNIA